MFVIPPFVEYVLETQGWRGAFRALSGVVFACLACGSLMFKSEVEDNLNKSRFVSSKFLQRSFVVTSLKSISLYVKKILKYICIINVDEATCKEIEQLQACILNSYIEMLL